MTAMRQVDAGEPRPKGWREGHWYGDMLYVANLVKDGWDESKPPRVYSTTTKALLVDGRHRAIIRLVRDEPCLVRLVDHYPT